MTLEMYGSYRVVRTLGEGGMGTVYEGVHSQLGRRAAIKVLHGTFARDPEIAARFFNEARAASIIEHPGIVEVYEFGHTADGTAYLIMELIKGESLAARLRARGGRLGGDGLRLARQIAAPLAVAHAKGIVHRDLKPENVMLTLDEEHREGERVKILDFGIAKMAAAETVIDGSGRQQEGPRDLHTRTGVVMGTPTYMAPEQCRGAGKVDAKADVYALGVIMYQMLVGRPPFVAAGAGELIAMHIFSPPPPLSEQAPGLPVALSDLVMQMLAKDPAARPPMAQVAAALGGAGSSGLLPIVSASPALPAGNTTLRAAVGQHGTVRLEAPPAPRQSGRLLAALGALAALVLGGLMMVRSSGIPPRAAVGSAATATPAPRISPPVVPTVRPAAPTPPAQAPAPREAELAKPTLPAAQPERPALTNRRRSEPQLRRKSKRPGSKELRPAGSSVIEDRDVKLVE